MIGVTVDDISRIKAFVIGIEPPADPDGLADELRAWCKEHLRRYEYPHVVDFVERLPADADGQDPALQAARRRGRGGRLSLDPPIPAAPRRRGRSPEPIGRDP